MNTQSQSGSLPSSLLVETPLEGLQLARVLAEHSLGLPPAAATMQDHLSTRASLPGLDTLTALYFSVVSAANAGWRVGAGPVHSSS